jgi:hypothetical protein
MKKTIIIYIVLFLLIPPKGVNAQLNNNLEAGVSNVLFGAFVGGVGAIINKKKEDKFSRSFARGAYKGAFGGLLLYGSKSLLSKASRDSTMVYYWPARLVNNLGVSVIENAASNRRTFEYIHVNFVFNRFDFNTTNHWKMEYRVLPFSLWQSIEHLNQYDFDFENTMLTGSMIFFDTPRNRLQGARGRNSFGNILLASIYRRNSQLPAYYRTSKYSTISHEIIHSFQYETLFVFNTFLAKPEKKIMNIKLIQFLNKYFYMEYSSLSMFLFRRNYQEGFIETEARFYSR